MNYRYMSQLNSLSKKLRKINHIISPLIKVSQKIMHITTVFQQIPHIHLILELLSTHKKIKLYNFSLQDKITKIKQLIHHTAPIILNPITKIIISEILKMKLILDLIHINKHQGN